MTTEDYVSYETAKLLKEKGFYQDFYNSFMPVWHYNGNNKVLSFTEDDGYPSETQEWYSAPTLQMAMKWLRDVHKIHIIVVPISFEDGIFWGYKIVQLCSNNDCLELHRSSVNVGFDTYEEAAESAIKYCLEKLI